MKKRGVLVLVLAAALFVAPPLLEAVGVELPAMMVSASGNNTGGNTNPGTGGGTGTTGRPSASGNNSYNPGNTESSIPEGSTIAVTNPTGYSVLVTTPVQDIARAAGLKSGEELVAVVEGAYGPLAEQLINSTAASANAKVAYICVITLHVYGRDGFPAVTELSAPIHLQMGVPESIDGNKYDFAVVRLHNGGAAILPDLDGNPETVTIASDRFSAYAVIYTPKGQLKGVKDSVPKTGDTIPAAIPSAAAVCFISVAGAAAALNKKKRV